MKFFYSKPIFTQNTWALLAITRFVLAFIVMISSGHLNKFADIGSFFSAISEFGGKTAVFVFLMISGISVGYSLMKSEEGFLKRRFIRIYPLYFTAVTLTVFLQYYLGSPHLVKDIVWVSAGYLTSISNYLLLQGIMSLTILYNGPLWSISVEVFLYLILPFLNRLRIRYIYAIALFSLFCFIIHTHVISYTLYGVQHIIFAWPFIIGFLMAVKKQFWGIIPLVLIGSFGMYYNNKMEYVTEPLSFIWFLIAFVVILCIMYLNTSLSNYTKIVFNYLGTISYPMYLFHYPLYFILYSVGVRDPYVFVVLSIFICIPINYIFDDQLKNIFWKPLIEKTESLMNFVLVNLKGNKLEKS